MRDRAHPQLHLVLNRPCFESPQISSQWEDRGYACYTGVSTALLRQPRRADRGLAVLAPIVDGQLDQERMHMEGPEPAGLALVAQ